ncbi:methylmalonyl Co-A mutase-associated GTPase MeaB [soil metagenome]
MSLEERFRAGDDRALARAITLVEAGGPEGRELLQRLRRGADPARIVGITGAPGSGKSTLVDRLVGSARTSGRTVAVVAVDPSSPFTGGAILGDRVRMTRWHDDDGVFIRSMAARGHLGGLAAATLQVVALMAAYGFDDVIVETVGVGQGEVEIVGVADTTLVVLTPGQGDGVQAVKAGVMEIADVFVVNKADHDGAGRVVRDVRAMLELAHPAQGAWLPTVLETVASQGQGIDAVVAAIAAHRDWLGATDALEAKRRGRARHEIGALVWGAARASLRALPEGAVDDVASGRSSPEALARRVIAHLAGSDDDAFASPRDGSPADA